MFDCGGGTIKKGFLKKYGNMHPFNTSVSTDLSQLCQGYILLRHKKQGCVFRKELANRQNYVN